MRLRLVYRAAWTIAAVCTDRGDCSLWEFLSEGVEDPGGTPSSRSQLGKEKVRMLARLRLIALHGPPRNAAVSHQIEPEIWQIEEGRLRVLWFYDSGKLIIASHGFVKRTRKTPEREKHLAREALRRYREAKARGAISWTEGRGESDERGDEEG
jgi:phage-related protein